MLKKILISIAIVVLLLPHLLVYLINHTDLKTELQQKIPFAKDINIHLSIFYKPTIYIKKIQLDKNIEINNIACRITPFNLLKKNIILDTNIKSINIKKSDKKNKNKYQVPNYKITPKDLTKFKFFSTINIDNLKYDEIHLKNIKAIINNNQNILNFIINNSHVKLKSQYTLSDKTPKFSADLNVDNFKIEQYIKNSKLNINSNLTSHGTDLRTLIQNLNGKLIAKISEGTYNKSIKILNFDIINSIFTAILPTNKNDNVNKLKCAIVNTKINNGIINSKSSIGIETSPVNILGSGNFNILTGNLNLELNPKPNQDFNPIDFSAVSYIKLTGNINSPKVTINPINIMKKSANVAAGLLSGGLSVIANEIVDSISKDPSGIENACETAMKN